MTRVSYQGTRGSYSELALIQLASRLQKPMIPVPSVSFEEAFLHVVDGSCDFALLPIQNSLGGSIYANYDLLVRYRLHIVREVHLQIRHCLMVLPGTKSASVSKIMSHPQALAQCDEFIRLYYPSVEVSPQYDTAGSAQLIRDQNLVDCAAIASELAANAYDMEIIAADIQDEPLNVTRFWLLSREADYPIYADIGLPAITSILFVLRSNIPGALFKALSVFALRDIDMTKIESRPAKVLGKFFDEFKGSGAAKDEDDVYKYVFYADVLEHAESDNLLKAISHLQEIAPLTRIMGCYPKDMYMSLTTPNDRKKQSITLSDDPVVSVKKRHSSFFNTLRIGIVGFGNFGQFLAKAFIAKGHTLIATNYTDVSEEVERKFKGAVVYVPTIDELIASNLDLLLIAVSILSFERVVNRIPFSASTLENVLVVDVLSVKTHPKRILKSKLLPTQDLLLTHPMFGPESGKPTWKGLCMVYEKVQISNLKRCNTFLNIFSCNGCEMISMPAEAHDAYAAGSQFITHLTGRVLGRLGPASTPINTKGFDTLLTLVENTCKDSFDLFYALFAQNTNSLYQLECFESAFLDIKDVLLRYNPSKSLSTVFDDDEKKEREMQISRMINQIGAPITTEIFHKVSKLEAEGHSILKLNIGEPDEKTPQPIIEGAMAALQSGQTKYTYSMGLLELRELICEKLREDNGIDYTPSQVVVSNGAKQSIAQAILAICNIQDEVLIPVPNWPTYREMCVIAGAFCVPIPTSVENNYKLTPELLEECLISHSRAKVLILCSPCNPTGAMFRREELIELAAVLKKFPRVWVICDEIYELIRYDCEHVSMASIPGMYHRTVTINGFSKGFVMTGFRVGYLAAPQHVASACVKIQNNFTSSSCTVSQYAAISALRMDRGIIDNIVADYKVRRDLVVAVLEEIEDIFFLAPDGAFYVFVDISQVIYNSRLADDVEFCMQLLTNSHVAVVPGSGFGLAGSIRICFANSVGVLRQAMDAFKDFVAAIKL